MPGGTIHKALEFLKDEWDRIWGIIKGAFDTISYHIQTLYTSNLGWLLPGGALIKAILFVRDEWDRIWGAVKSKFEEVSEGIRWVYDNSIGKLLGQNGIIAAAVRGLRNIWDEVWGGIKDGFREFMAPIVGRLTTVKGLIDDVLELIKKIRIPRIPGLGAVGGFFKGFAGYAGGIQSAPGGPALVGEEGPEIVNLKRGSSVTPNGMGGTTVNVNFYGPVYGVDDFNEKVNQARLAWERAGN